MLRLVMRIVVVGLLLLAFGSFAMTYTVRFTESAVLTTFGSAGEDAIKSSPGLYLKLPYPFQNVTKYDTRARLIQTRSATQQTRDDSQVIVEAFAVWTVDDPLEFFQRFSSAGRRAEDHYERAEEILRSALQSAVGETSNFSLAELFRPEQGGSAIPDLEARMLEVLTGGAGETGSGLSDYGVSVAFVGVNRVVLPEQTTQKVIQRMGENRDRLAAELQTQGTALAQSLQAQANADAEKIRAFAQRRAAEIRAQGEFEAAEYLAQQNELPELAVFLDQVAMLRGALAERFTLIVSEDDAAFNIFSPGALNGLEAGQLPVQLDPATALSSAAGEGGE